MIHRQKQRGFTIVELIVVIVVIAILAAITLVAYDGIQKNAMDAKIRTTIDDVGKALLIKQFDGQTVSSTGYWSNGNGTTTFGVDQLVIPDFLQTGYRSDITSSNVLTSTVGGNKNNNVFRYYVCSTGGFTLYASLNRPSDDDIANLTSIRQSCGNTSTVPITGSYVYNYAKTFK